MPGFKLSVSPERLETENSFTYPKTPNYVTKEILKISKTQRVPMGIVNKFAGRYNNSNILTAKTQNLGRKHELGKIIL